MTTPQRPASQPTGSAPGWDDDRLGAAFEARAARVVVPVDLVAVTVERLRPTSGSLLWLADEAAASLASPGDDRATRLS